jgi:quercetin dioxygenase-like cupin family protein
MCLPIRNFKSNKNSKQSSSLSSEIASISKMASIRPHAQLPAPRLVVTGHTKGGSSIFASDTVVPQFHPFGPAGSGFSNFHSSETVPVSNVLPIPDLGNVLPRCPPAGVNFGISDFAPNGRSPMHRTISADYAIVLEGEIILSLDSGEKKTIRKGEFILQRGTNHEWINPSSEVTCRILFVMIGAEKIVLGDGTALEQTVLGPKK